MPKPSTTTPPREPGFSLVEIIVAMFILSVVVTGFALAVQGGERAGMRDRAVGNKMSIAKKAHEQIQGNVDAHRRCGTVWTPAEQVVGTGAVQYAECRFPQAGYETLVDEDGRNYQVAWFLRAVDEPTDGTGLAKALDSASAGGDADFDTRDRIDVRVEVRLDPASAAGLPAAIASDTYVMHGQADWHAGETLGTARVHVCILDRPDRAMANGRCVVGNSGEDAPATRANGVTIRLTPTGGGTSFTATSSSGMASFNGVLPNGTYDVAASNLGGNLLFKMAPKAITISGTDPQEGTVYLSRTGSRFDVCGRIRNPDYYGFGWKVTQTTLNWGALGAPLRRGTRISGMNNAWKCVTSAVADPLGYSNNRLFRGRYVLEVATARGGNGSMSVASIGPCASGNQATWGLFNAAGVTNPGTLVTPAVRYGLDLTDRTGATAAMCIEFVSTPIAALDCTSTAPWPCRLVDTQCIPASCQPTVGCWNCGTIPVPADAALPSLAIAGVHNGPNEGNVSCRNRQLSNTWSSPFHSGSRSPRANWWNRPFLGVYNPYLSMSGQAKHPDGRWNECPEIAFTFTRSMTNTCGSFSIGNPCSGSRPYSLGDCLEVKLNGRVVRGPLYDTFIAGQPSVGIEIGAWDRFIDHPYIDIDWFAFGVATYSAPHEYGVGTGASPSWMNGFPKVRYRKVTNDPVCQSSSQPVDTEDRITDIVPPTIVNVYKRPGPDDVGDPMYPPPGLLQLAPVTSNKSL